MNLYLIVSTLKHLAVSYPMKCKKPLELTFQNSCSK